MEKRASHGGPEILVFLENWMSVDDVKLCNPGYFSFDINELNWSCSLNRSHTGRIWDKFWRFGEKCEAKKSVPTQTIYCSYKIETCYVPTVQDLSSNVKYSCASRAARCPHGAQGLTCSFHYIHWHDMSTVTMRLAYRGRNCEMRPWTKPLKQRKSTVWSDYRKADFMWPSWLVMYIGYLLYRLYCFCVFLLFTARCTSA